ncbi:type II secretion system protein [Vibrio pacinii]|uniref:type II secretion system protein n=1 Tax=Vibrio pacinii TaxID=170674 RepID=UPI00057003C2|nr:type II secretion system protein [Vibrio pacinii]
MKKQSGFTLIELVVVIVILGILAVTAAPRFLNLQGDAREASLEGLRGAISGAMGIVYGGSAIAGEETLGRDEADTDNNTPPLSNGVRTSFGYPIADATGIGQALDLSDDFVVLQTSADDVEPAFIDYGFNNFSEQCVRYTEAANATTPATVALRNGVAGESCGVPAAN